MSSYCKRLKYLTFYITWLDKKFRPKFYPIILRAKTVHNKNQIKMLPCGHFECTNCLISQNLFQNRKFTGQWIICPFYLHQSHWFTRSIYAKLLYLLDSTWESHFLLYMLMATIPYGWWQPTQCGFLALFGLVEGTLCIGWKLLRNDSMHYNLHWWVVGTVCKCKKVTPIGNGVHAVHIGRGYPVADPGFPRGGGAKCPGRAPTYNFAKFFQKLHEIERIWTGGARVQNFTM